MNETKFTDSSGYKRIGIKSKCESCGNEFVHLKHRKRKFCSSKCAGLQKTNNQTTSVRCSWCNIAFKKKTSHLAKSKSGLYFCSRVCKDEAQKLGGIPEIMPSHYGTSKSPNLDKLSQNKIECVGCKENKNYLLFVHHIDGNHNNDSEENLEVVCPTCHVKRHLRLVNGIWIYSTKFLTPREELENV